MSRADYHLEQISRTCDALLGILVAAFPEAAMAATEAQIAKSAAARTLREEAIDRAVRVHGYIPEPHDESPPPELEKYATWHCG